MTGARGAAKADYDYDVGIIGGGPGGGSLGAYLAKAGLRCAIFEKEKFPRPHVGESLVPSSTRVFRDLDFLPTMEKARFPHKYGAVWTSTQSNRTYDTTDWHDLRDADVRFDERDQPGVTQAYTYHVDRGLFDKLLLEHAEGLGATVRQGVAVKNVDFGEKRPVMQLSDGTSVRVRMVADASGRDTALAKQLRLKVMDKVFDQLAVHTWFEGYSRLSAFSKKEERFGDYIYIHFLPVTNTWVWQIPITDTITSIGVVSQKKNFVKSVSELEDYFWKNVASRKELHDGLKQSKQVRPFKAEGDYSYAAEQIAGDRFVLIGDASRFVDPIFSTGVSIALNSSRFASRDIIAACEADDFSKERFNTYETTIRRGTNNWYNFITVYYRLNVLFTKFINDPKYRLDVLKLLQGDVYDEQPPEVLDKMREIVTGVENNPRHIFHHLLGDLTADAFRPEF
jgi:1H-pyrrole-2-carbonyl-[peptidyl-carrier protein] chlorinase